MRPLVIVGASGQGRETVATVQAINAVRPSWELVGVVDDAPGENKELLEFLGTEWIGPTSWVEAAPADVAYVLGIAAPTIKRRMDSRFVNRPTATLVHPTAHVGPAVSLGPGCVIAVHCSLTTNIHLGRHVHLNPLCNVGHDTSLGSYTTVNPLAAVSGRVAVGEGVLIGTQACVLQGLSVGDGATVGASACVVRSVSEGQTVKGVPAR